MITFYDIHSILPRTAWNSHTWKVCYILNYKKIPYRTEYIEYPDIEGFSKKLGIPPTGTNFNGLPFYTLPAIHDSTTGITMADSFRIAKYLDATYPETPKVVIEDTEVLTIAFADNFNTEQEFCRTEAVSGKILEELMAMSKEEKAEGFKKTKEVLGQADGWFKSAGWEKKFIMGDKPTFADFSAAGPFISLRILLGEESEEWKEIASWHDGRWARLLEELKDWEVIV
ncbi:hypothetical protein BDQ17DRAFT_1514189 [Cyathus striatus]|nr:hypothetical protein BDQ17DRAFT_1514189 [Cyathus striatus]